MIRSNALAFIASYTLFLVSCADDSNVQLPVVSSASLNAVSASDQISVGSIIRIDTNVRPAANATKIRFGDISVTADFTDTAISFVVPFVEPGNYTVIFPLQDGDGRLTFNIGPGVNVPTTARAGLQRILLSVPLADIDVDTDQLRADAVEQLELLTVEETEYFYAFLGSNFSELLEFSSFSVSANSFKMATETIIDPFTIASEFADQTGCEEFLSPRLDAAEIIEFYDSLPGPDILGRLLESSIAASGSANIADGRASLVGRMVWFVRSFYLVYQAFQANSAITEPDSTCYSIEETNFSIVRPGGVSSDMLVALDLFSSPIMFTHDQDESLAILSKTTLTENAVEKLNIIRESMITAFDLLLDEDVRQLIPLLNPPEIGATRIFVRDTNDYSLQEESKPDVKFSVGFKGQSSYLVRATIIDTTLDTVDFTIRSLGRISEDLDISTAALVSAKPPVSINAEGEAFPILTTKDFLPAIPFNNSGYVITRFPSFGVIELLDDSLGKFEYSVVERGVASDSFEYIATNSIGESKPATVTLKFVDRIAIDPAGTFYNVDTVPGPDFAADVKKPASRTSVTPLESIEILSVGAAKVTPVDSPEPDDNSLLNGVFFDSITSMILDRSDLVPDANVPTSLYRGLDQNVTGDFVINDGGTNNTLLIKVPIGPINDTQLLFAKPDSYYADNNDPNGDFAAYVRKAGLVEIPEED